MEKLNNIASESWISRMSNMIKAGGGINLAQGIPGFSPPGELLEILRNKVSGDVHQYPPGNGQAKLVKQICANYKQYRKLVPEEILVVQGATEGINLVYTYLVNRLGNDWYALAFDPVYESYRELPKIYNNNLVKIPLMAGGEISREKVEGEIDSKNVKLVFVNSPGNPYGKIWSRDEFEWIMRLSKKKGFYVLIDAVYKDLYFGSDEPYYPLSGDWSRLFYVNSFSKMLSITGWRIGYLMAESGIMKELRSIHDYTGLCAASILQYSISDYLEENEYGRKYVSGIRNILAENYLYAKKELEALGFIPEETGGGYFIWCRLPENKLSGVEFALQLYEQQKVGVIPGIHFRDEAQNWIRINIARDKDELSTALKSIKVFIKEIR